VTAFSVPAESVCLPPHLLYFPKYASVSNAKRCGREEEIQMIVGKIAEKKMRG
jgi:hypothetical protein